MPDYEKIAASVKAPKAPPKKPEERVCKIIKPARPKIPGKPKEMVVQTIYPVDHPRYQELATQKGYDQSRARIEKTRYSHEAMIDVIIANPTVKQKELAETFGRTIPWISRIMGSDAFQAALAKRREEVTDPFLVATVEERFRGLAYQSLDIITEKLALTENTDLALKALDVSVKVLGFGARAGGPTQNNQFVIQLPPKAANSADWALEHQPKQIEG